MMMSDRIKLAEAMFPDNAFDVNINGDPLMCHNDDWGDDSRITCVPDPFTDANDDYAVLEWMRGRGLQDDSNLAMDEAWFAMPDKGEYQIGDYARAALKVIDND